MRRIIFLIVLVLCSFIPGIALSQSYIKPYQSPKLLYPDLVTKFYQLNHQEVFWFTSAVTSSEIRMHFLQVLDSAVLSGLDKNKYHYSEIVKSAVPVDSSGVASLDRIFTDALIAYSKDLYQGENVLRWINNDEVSGKYSGADNDYLLRNMARIRYAAELDAFVSSLEPKDASYASLKREYHKQLAANKTALINQLVASMNLYRWVHHFNFEKFIVVNIPSATLRYYEKDSLKLQMKVVVGKPATRSPRFSTWCYQVVLYPYWNVPRDIGLKELLPRFKRSPASIETMNMQILGSNGKIIDPHSINWAKYNRHNFPYSFRQCTGCENSLGVIKFNLTDPFSVYLHDTNFKLAFLKKSRYLSHGCIRVEKPIEMANYLLNNKLDSSYVKACLKNQQPDFININKPVPVFVLYSTAEARNDSVVFYKDIYHLFK